MRQGIAILAAVLAPCVVSAQATGATWSELDTAGLSTVYVLDDAGVEVSGEFLRLDPDALVLTVGDVAHRIDAVRVRRIDRRGDSLRNGAVIGAVVGGAVGLFTARFSDCPGSGSSGPCPVARVAGFLLSTGFYAAIGAGIDALNVGRTTLYEGPTAPSRSERAPDGRRIAINLTVRW